MPIEVEDYHELYKRYNKAVEALGFYANSNNYFSSNMDNNQHIKDRITAFDLDGYQAGGKLARKTLKDLDEPYEF